MDFVMIALTVLFFLAAGLYVGACDRLSSGSGCKQ